jgi:hypothetical protein
MIILYNVAGPYKVVFALVPKGKGVNKIWVQILVTLYVIGPKSYAIPANFS